MPRDIRANHVTEGSMQSSQSQSNQVSYFLEKCQAIDENDMIATTEYKNSAAIRYSGS